MRHLDRLIQRHPKLRHVDFQRLAQQAKADPLAHWEGLVEASIPIAYTTALRLADDLRNGPAIAEEATQEVFEAIHRDDFRILREYVGYGKWPSLVARLTAQTPVLRTKRQAREVPDTSLERELRDPHEPVPPLDAGTRQRLDAEGDRFLVAMGKVVANLHHIDRLLLGMRYEQELTLAELDQLFRLGSPTRVQSLLDRLANSLQPLRAVSEAWQLAREQRHAVLRHVVKKLYREGSMETDESRAIAPALQQR